MSGLIPPNPLSYEGQVVVSYVAKTFPPTTAFNKFNVPTIWIDTAAQNAYILVAKPLGVADWVPIGGTPGEVDSLTGNTGGAVFPTANNIDVIGDGTYITVTGNPGTSTLTISPTSLLTNYISLTPYIVGSDVHSGYSTIQAAITAAVTAGASSSAWAYIYVKPGTYTENLTLHDGIAVIGIALSDINIADALTNGVVLNGSVTISTGLSKLQGISFRRTTGSVALITGGKLYLNCCDGSLVSGQLFHCTGATDKFMYVADSTFNFDAASSIISHDGSNCFAKLQTRNSTYDCAGVTSTLSGPNGFVAVEHFNDRLVSHSYVYNCANAIFESLFTAVSGNANNPIVTTSASTEADVQINNSSIDVGTATPVLNIGKATATSSITNSNILFNTTLTPNVYAAGQKRESSFQIWDNSPFTDSAMVYNALVTGYVGSEYTTKQAFLHTTSGAAQTLISYTPAAGTAVTISGSLTGSNVGHTDITGGNFMVVADGTAAAIVGTPVINVCTSTTGDITATFSAGAVLIQVTAPSAAAYNWVSTYNIQPVISNS